VLSEAKKGKKGLPNALKSLKMPSKASKLKSMCEREKVQKLLWAIIKMLVKPHKIRGFLIFKNFAKYFRYLSGYLPLSI